MHAPRSRPHARTARRRRHAARALAALSLTLLAACGNEADDGAGNSCEYVADDAPPARPVDPPPAAPEVSGQAPVTLSTSVGDLSMTLDAETAPCTVNSFLSLAEQGYFDGTACHRLTTEGIFVLQCGDPTGTGAGGPGYAFADELAGTETYPAGTLAMANAGAADTNGSQFFMVYADTMLPPSYTVFGRLDDASVRTVAEVAENGTTSGTPDGPPRQQVTIESVAIGE